MKKKTLWRLSKKFCAKKKVSPQALHENQKKAQTEAICEKRKKKRNRSLEIRIEIIEITIY